MIGIIAGNFIGAHFFPSYNNPFFDDWDGIAIVIGFPTMMFYLLRWRKGGHLRDAEAFWGRIARWRRRLSD